MLQPLLYAKWLSGMSVDLQWYNCISNKWTNSYDSNRTSVDRISRVYERGFCFMNVAIMKGDWLKELRNQSNCLFPSLWNPCLFSCSSSLCWLIWTEICAGNWQLHLDKLPARFLSLLLWHWPSYQRMFRLLGLFWVFSWPIALKIRVDRQIGL